MIKPGEIKVPPMPKGVKPPREHSEEYEKGMQDCKNHIADILMTHRYSDEEVLERIIDYIGIGVKYDR